MNIPDKVRVGGHEYRVVKDYVFVERADLTAQAAHDTCAIRLGQGYRESCRSKQEEIFIHEILHSVDWVYNGGKLEESSVENIGQGLYQVLKDNKIF